MPKVNDVTFGAPVWMDLSTSDLEKAKAFYGGLFGWTASDNGEEFGHYHIFSKGQDAIAGGNQKGPDESGMPDVWTIYLASEDAAATTEAVKAAGGQVMFGPMEVGDHGSMSIASDPSGAFFGIWQPNVHRGFTLSREQGAPVWHELLSRDFEAASEFYGKVFGVEIAAMEMGEEAFGYKTINVNGEMCAGIMDATNVLPEGVPSNWVVYFGVDDTDAAVVKALELGGTVLAPASDTPYGRFAMLADSTGAAFAVITYQD